MESNSIIKRKNGEDFIIAEFGAFSDEMKMYFSLRGAKAVDYLLSIGYTSDRNKWLHGIHSNDRKPIELLTIDLEYKAVNHLAVAFSMELINDEDLSVKDFEAIVKENKNRGNSNTCASQEYTDSNMVMNKCFNYLFGVDINPLNELHIELVNSSWELAIKHDFNVYKLRDARILTTGL